MSSGSSVDIRRGEVAEFTRARPASGYEQHNVASEMSSSLYSSRVDAGASYRCAPTVDHERSRIQERRPLDLRHSYEPGESGTFPAPVGAKDSTAVRNAAFFGVSNYPVYEKMSEVVTAPVEELQSLTRSSGAAQPMEVTGCRPNSLPGQLDRFGLAQALPEPLVVSPDRVMLAPFVSGECATDDAAAGERAASSSDQVSMEVTHPVNSPSASLHLVAACQEEQVPLASAAEVVAVPTMLPSRLPVCEVAVPTGVSPLRHIRNPIDYVEAVLGHATECHNLKCDHECHRMKKEIDHCLRHDALKQYKKCDQCTGILEVCLYHVRVCHVPQCAFFFCRTLKARLKRSCMPLSQAVNDSGNRPSRLDHVHQVNNIVYKGPGCSFQGGSFVENIDYAVLTPKVVGHGQNGNVCEVEMLKPIAHNGTQHQITGMCMKKCKYHGEEVEVVKRLLSHQNIVQTCLIVRCNDQMLVFMPRLNCSLVQFKSQMVKEQCNLSDLLLSRVRYDVACGLSYMHGMGIVHRDIKAANLLLQSDPFMIKICDFGHAKYIGLGGLAAPCPNCGTQGYRAPEIVKSEPHGFKVDIYATGITLLHLALPFDWESRWPRGIAKGTCILEYMPDIGNVIALCCQEDVTQRLSAVQLMLASRSVS